MVRDYFTTKELADILDVYEVSAKELLDGIIRFTSDEIRQLANYKDVSIEELIG